MNCITICNEFYLVHCLYIGPKEISGRRKEKNDLKNVACDCDGAQCGAEATGYDAGEDD